MNKELQQNLFALYDALDRACKNKMSAATRKHVIAAREAVYEAICEIEHDEEIDGMFESLFEKAE